MRETRSITIKNTPFTITQLGAMTGRKVLLRAVRLIAPVVRSGANRENVEAVIEAVLSNIEEADFDFMCDAFSGATSMKKMTTAKMPMLVDVPFNFDEHFAGNYTAMFEWLTAHIKLNFESFLVEIGEMMKGLATPPPATVDASSNTPTA